MRSPLTVQADRLVVMLTCISGMSNKRVGIQIPSILRAPRGGVPRIKRLRTRDRLLRRVVALQFQSGNPTQDLRPRRDFR